MTQHVFTIKIHCRDNATTFTQDRSVVAPNDVVARETAVKKLLAEYRGYAKSDIPVVLFCEIEHIVELA